MTARDLPVRGRLVIPGDEIVETASRSSGPGGQHVNKTSTRITLRWSVADSRVLGAEERARIRSRLAARLTRTGSLVVHAGRHRSQARNRELARERLAELVGGALETPRKRVATKPGRAAKERALAAKRRRAEVKRGRGRVRRDD
jgi:ribosome-associated protein